jgi:hypothetical protein
MSNRTDIIAVLSNQWTALPVIRAALKQEDAIVSSLLQQLHVSGKIWKMTEITGHHYEVKYCLVHDVSDAICLRRGGLPRCTRCLGILE